jgi:hypothetical protein
MTIHAELIYLAEEIADKMGEDHVWVDQLRNLAEEVDGVDGNGDVWTIGDMPLNQNNLMDAVEQMADQLNKSFVPSNTGITNGIGIRMQAQNNLINNGVFYFELWDPDNDTGRCYGFNMVITNPDLNTEFDPDYENFAGDIEMDYGTHDWSSRPRDEVMGFGYSAYEVDPKLNLELMRKWREYFESRSDVQDTTEIVEVPYDKFEDFDDFDIYNYIGDNK